FSIEGNIYIVAGNGATEMANLALPANMTSLINTAYWAVDRATGGVYAAYKHAYYGNYLLLNRSTGLWEHVLGSSSGTNYTTADGLVGVDVHSDSTQSRSMLLEFDNNQLITARMRYNGEQYQDFMLKTYDSAD